MAVTATSLFPGLHSYHGYPSPPLSPPFAPTPSPILPRPLSDTAAVQGCVGVVGVGGVGARLLGSGRGGLGEQAEAGGGVTGGAVGEEVDAPGHAPRGPAAGAEVALQVQAHLAVQRGVEDRKSVV